MYYLNKFPQILLQFTLISRKFISIITNLYFTMLYFQICLMILKFSQFLHYTVPFLDPIDWILSNLIDNTKSRRMVIKKLKQMMLLDYKGPKKTSRVPTEWEEHEVMQLTELFNQFREASGIYLPCYKYPLILRRHFFRSYGLHIGQAGCEETQTSCNAETAGIGTHPGRERYEKETHNQS